MIPREFRSLPPLLPPDMDAPGNPDHLWLVTTDWRTPPLNGQQVCIRGARLVGGGQWFGFWTDGTSVIRACWTLSGLTPMAMPFLCAALGHDAWYAAELGPREQGDAYLREWARMAGVNLVQRNLAYAYVRAGGYEFAWKQHTPASISAARQVCQLVKAGADPVWQDPVIPKAECTCNDPPMPEGMGEL